MKSKNIIIAIIMIFLSNLFVTDVSAFSSHPYYIKNSKMPKHLYVIQQNNLSPAENTMITTLQGVISNKSDFQIYTLNKNQPDYKIWLEDLKENYGINYSMINDPWYLLGEFKNFVKGYVLYDNFSKKDPSINNACSLASLKDSIVVDKSIESKVKNIGIKMQYDCRNTDKYWAYNNLWNLGLNHSTVIELSPNRDAPLRDYGIMSKSLIFYEDDPKDFSLRNKVFGSMNKDSTCLGWGPDEQGNISAASRNGVSVIPADWSYNLTVLSAFPSSPVIQKSTANPMENFSAGNMHYVTFIMSDGDNQQWNLGSNYGSKKWYGSPKRGNFNMGFSINPSLYELAPTVLKMYYKNASSDTFRDYFIVSPSGNGYMYPSEFKPDSLNPFLKRLNSYMKDVDQKYVSVLDNWSFYNRDLWNKYTAYPNIQGIFYLNYSRQDDYKGKIIWSNGKPVVSCRNLLWSKIGENEDLVKDINGYVKSGYTDITTPYAYTFVYVHAWSKNMKDINQVIEQLNKNPAVKVVTPDIFMQLIRKNITHM
ncbi:GxGYxYP domain-containing protein [Clostridium sp. Mt-5]|uniref:GxGYxYP domain-containing protein n=1 Tax=Clostridium moutaii TaxID=3240932 RepID=A0ABV4BNM0_9CLOT